MLSKSEKSKKSEKWKEKSEDTWKLDKIRLTAVFHSLNEYIYVRVILSQKCIIPYYSIMCLFEMHKCCLLSFDPEPTRAIVVASFSSQRSN